MPRNHRRVTINAKSESNKEPAPTLSVQAFVEKMEEKYHELQKFFDKEMFKYVNPLEFGCGLVRLSDYKKYLKEFFKSIGIENPTHFDSDRGDFYEGSNAEFTVGAGLLIDDRYRTQVFMYVNKRKK
jgi:hypothetical protein